jgi:hypothetical protein
VGVLAGVWGGWDIHVYVDVDTHEITFFFFFFFFSLQLIWLSCRLTEYCFLK